MGAVKPATANTKRVLAILAINILARVPATPVAQAPPVVANILNAIARHLILGAVALAPAPVLTNIPAPGQATPVAPVPPAAENIPPAPAPADRNGKMDAANSN